MDTSIYTGLHCSLVTEQDELDSLSKTLKTFAEGASKRTLNSVDQKMVSVFQESLDVLSHIQHIVKNRIYGTDFYGKGCLIAVAKDQDLRIQAVALFTTNQCYNEKACASLNFLASAYWNLEHPDNAFIPYRVRGAGAALVHFCSEQGRLKGTDGEVFLISIPVAHRFYEKLGFVALDDDDPTLVDYFLDADSAKALCERFPEAEHFE